MPRILLTGAAGFAGAHFLEHVLATTDWDVVTISSFRHRGSSERIVQVLDGDPASSGPPAGGAWWDRMTMLTHDLTAPVSQQGMHQIAGPDGLDYLVAIASESHVDRSITDPVPFAENNLAVALNTLELARALKPRAVVLISTDEVYGPAEPGHAHKEWSTILPSNPYSGSKAAQEAMAISYWRTYGVPVIISNTMNLIGERQHPEKYIPKTLRAILEGTEAVIHGSPGNIGSRHYLHARNMADAVLFLLRKTKPSMFPAHMDEWQRSAAFRAEVKGRPATALADRPDRYNIASADRIDNLQLAQMIAVAAGMPLRYRLEDFHSQRPGHDPHYALDPAKITALGWKPPVEFTESLSRTIRWTLARPEWLAG